MKKFESKGLRTTIYKVDDLIKAKEWYTKAFDLKPYFDEPFYVGFNIGGYELGLLPEKADKPKTANVLSYWGVEDIYDSFDWMISNGAKELEIPNDVGEGIMVALVKDPWDNVIGLIKNPYFKLTQPKETIIEWAPLSLKEGVREAELLELASILQNEFLVKQRGFLKRELLKKSDTLWVDLIYWESEKSAKRAMQASRNSDACTRYFQIMDIGEDEIDSSLSYYNIISQY